MSKYSWVNCYFHIRNNLNGNKKYDFVLIPKFQPLKIRIFLLGLKQSLGGEADMSSGRVSQVFKEGQSCHEGGFMFV